MPVRPKRTGIMLAYPATERAMQKLGDSCFAQPKLNGERARVEWFHGEPVLLSSYGNEFKFLQHIKEAITAPLCFKYNQKSLDGELYVHGWNRERIHSAASRKVNENPDTVKLEFHVFDYKSDQTQWQRIHTLTVKKDLGCFNWPLVYVPYDIISTTPQDWMNQVYKYTQEGYEGAIFRGALWNYEEKRSKGMLKFKPTESDIYEILGVSEAISKEGNPKAMVGSFQVSGDDETEFSVGAGKLSHPERERLWRDKRNLLGKKLLVKHELLKTRTGVPLCAVAVEVLG